MQSDIKKFFRSILLSQALGAGLLFLFLTVLSLAILPDLHQEIHHDAQDEEHSCAVTLILSGGTDTPNISTNVAHEIQPTFESKIISSVSIPSFFLSGYLREHAPPSVS